MFDGAISRMAEYGLHHLQPPLLGIFLLYPLFLALVENETLFLPCFNEFLLKNTVIFPHL